MAAAASEGGKYYLYNTRRNELLAKVFLKTLRIPYRHVEEGETKDLYWKAMGIINQDPEDSDVLGRSLISHGAVINVRSLFSQLRALFPKPLHIFDLAETVSVKSGA